ncbi:hypothetical protein ACH3XW_26865 [Acanthocheilonema viteae]
MWWEGIGLRGIRESQRERQRNERLRSSLSQLAQCTLSTDPEQPLLFFQALSSGLWEHWARRYKMDANGWKF